MFEGIMNFIRKMTKKEDPTSKSKSKDAAKERLHLVLMQDRANVSADFLELMKQEIIEVIKKYIDIDESAIDVRLTNKENEDGTNGAPALYANIPILNIKDENKKIVNVEEEKDTENRDDEESNNKDEEVKETEKQDTESNGQDEINSKEDSKEDNKIENNEDNT